MIHIAFWSGPRNISTALMRAWENRPDTTVSDEPLYAHYLQQTGLKHPLAAEIIAHYEADWQQVVHSLTGPIPGGKMIWFQKHMTHHLLPHIKLDWICKLSNCLLLREPAAMLASLARVLPNPTIEQTGLPQQYRLFTFLAEESGRIPLILDARDLLENPRPMLQQLCTALAVPFSEKMVAWPAGKRPSDGIWAPHWYAAVEQSTGFTPYQPPQSAVPPHLLPLLEQLHPLYQQLYRHRIKPSI